MISSYFYKSCTTVGLLILSILIDWKGLSTLLPPPCTEFGYTIYKTIIWIDQIVLLGKRFRGREWNKDEFEVDRPANTAQSSYRKQYLWMLPPPSIQQIGRDNCANITYLKRKEWGNDTTEHVAAIDFCYLVLREDFVNNQYTKLRTAVRKIRTKEDTVDDHHDVKDTPSNKVVVDGGFVATPSASSIASKSLPSNEDEPTFFFERSSPLLASDHDESVIDSHIVNDNSPGRMDTQLDREISMRLQDILETDDDEDDEDEDIDSTKTGDAGSASTHSRASLDSCSQAAMDMNWMDVGAEIGIKLLGSAAVQKAMTSHDTAERISTIKERVDFHMSAAKKHHEHSENKVFPDKNETGHSEDGNNPRRRNQHALIPLNHSNSITLPVHSMWTSATAVSPSGSIDTQEERNDLSMDTSLVDGNRVDYSTSPAFASLVSNSNHFSHKSNEMIHDLNMSFMPEASTPTIQETPPLTESSIVLRSKSSDCLPRRKSDITKASIEVVCDENDSRKVLIKSGTPQANPPKRNLLLPGVKIVVPVFPLQPGSSKSQSHHFKKSRFQMATVVSSKRLCIYKKNQMPLSGNRGTNCLSITVKLDKCFLRNGEFATLTLRVMDDWGARYMPRHSKLPLGSCVSTSFGLGVLVGWRVEDDIHIVRCLWQHRGSGSACAYLRRDSIHSTMEAAVGFDVNTAIGRGTVVAYVNGGQDFRCGRYFVSISEEGRHHRQVLQLNRSDILSCESAKYVPIVEHIREAAQYQLQLDFYEELLMENENGEEDDFDENKMLGEFSKNFNILWKSFLRAIDEDEGFDEGMNAFIQSCINFLNQLDSPEGIVKAKSSDVSANVVITATESSSHASRSVSSIITSKAPEKADAGFWVMDNIFGIFGSEKETGGKAQKDPESECIEIECAPRRLQTFDKTYQRAFAVLRTLMRTVKIAQAAAVDEPDFKMGLSVCYEFLLFIKTVIKVQRKNMNPDSIEVWRRAWSEIVSVFGPVQERLTRIGEGIAGKHRLCSVFFLPFEYLAWPMRKQLLSLSEKIRIDKLQYVTFHYISEALAVLLFDVQHCFTNRNLQLCTALSVCDSLQREWKSRVDELKFVFCVLLILLCKTTPCFWQWSKVTGGDVQSKLNMHWFEQRSLTKIAENTITRQLISSTITLPPQILKAKVPLREITRRWLSS